MVVRIILPELIYDSTSDALCIEKKKKKKKKKSKKKKTANGAMVQTEHPRVPVSKLFPDGNYPEGETIEYKNECVFYLSLPYDSFSFVHYPSLQ